MEQLLRHSKLTKKQMLTFCLLHCGSGGLPTSVIRTTFSGTRTGNHSQSATTTNNLPLCLTLKRRTTDINVLKNKRQNANPSAKSKELHPNAQSQINAAHLLLLQRTSKKLTD